MTRSPLFLERVPLPASVDILVAGSGSAGSCAAIAARSSGRWEVMLIERYGFAGGTSTQMLDTFYGFFTPGECPRKVAGGIPDHVVDRLDAAGAIFMRPTWAPACAGSLPHTSIPGGG